MKFLTTLCAYIFSKIESRAIASKEINSICGLESDGVCYDAESDIEQLEHEDVTNDNDNLES